MPKYVIHLGPSKTGSKYLQSTLYQCREALLEAGISYPDTWWNQPIHITHDPLWRLLRENRQPEVQDGFRQLNASTCRIVVLSCEAFADLTPEQFAVLRDAIGNNPIELVYYCRRWTERIPSDWKQSVQMGRFATFPEFYVDYIRNAFYSGSVNYSLIWSTVASIFGRKSLKLVSYSDLRDRNIDLFRHFATNFLGWNGVITAPGNLIMDRTSPNIFDVETIRALNWIDYQNIGRYRNDMRIKYTTLRAEIDNQMLEELMADDLGTLELSDGAEVFRLSWKEMNKFSDCIVPKSFLHQRPFELRAASIQYVRGNYLLKDRAIRALWSLHKRLDGSQVVAAGIA